MKIALLSDIHATSHDPVGRKDSIIDVFKRKFLFILMYAIKNNCIILQAGDFCEKSRDWHILYLMIKLLNKYKIKLFSIFGQHDTYMDSERKFTPTTMSVLNRFGLIKVLNERPVIIGNVYLYGCNWESKIPTPKKGKVNILVIHASITIKGIYPGHDFTSIRHFIKKNKGWSLILAGDIHIQSVFDTGKKGDTIVVNTGPMLRLASNKYNMAHKPCFFVYDTKKHGLKKVEIPHKPAKEVLTRNHLDKIKRREDTLSEKSLERFVRLMIKKQKKPLFTLADIMSKIMIKRNTNKNTKNLLMEIMEDGKVS